MNKKEIEHLAKQLMFELSDDELIMVEQDFVLLDRQLELLNKLDTDKVKPLVYPDEAETDYLRADEISDIMHVEDVLRNVENSKDDLVVVAKVDNR